MYHSLADRFQPLSSSDYLAMGSQSCQSIVGKRPYPVKDLPHSPFTPYQQIKKGPKGAVQKLPRMWEFLV